MKIKKNFLIIIMVLIAIVFVLGGYIYYKNETMVPVLGYHALLPHDLNTENAELIIDSEEFEAQLKILKKLGYKSLTLDEYYCWQRGKCKKPHRAVLITFDDGYQNNYDYAFPLLKKYNMNAVVFVIGENYYGDTKIFMNKEILEKAKKEYPNIEFASHTYNHHSIDAKEYDEVIEDVQNMKKVIDTDYLAYPHGQYTEEYKKALKDSGYKMAFTFGSKAGHRKSSLSDDPFEIPRLNISNGYPNWKFIMRLLLPM